MMHADPPAREYYDLAQKGRSHDMLSLVGLLQSVRLTLQIVEEGLLWSGIPCSSWVFMNVSRTCRCQDNVWGSADSTAAKDSMLLCCIGGL